MEQHPDSPAAAAAPAAASPEGCAEPVGEANPEPGQEAGPSHPLAATPENTAPEDPTPPETYDPAEYRWVPVRRRPRYDGWTEEKQRRFIETLADTGLVGVSAKAVGMSRESAYRLRRSPHGAAFARAWDAARQYAGGPLEDIAFERAIEGVAHNVYDEYGEVVCTKQVYNDRLLMFLLRHLKPERYGGAAAAAPAEPELGVAEALQAMEPLLPAPPEQLLGPEELGYELHLADIADGNLPHFLSEQRPEKTAAREQAEAWAAQEERGKAACEKMERSEGELSRAEFADMCRYLDPAGRAERSRKRYR